MARFCLSTTTSGSRRSDRVILCAVILILASCSGSSLESRVSGLVTLDGKPVGPGIVVFSPVNAGKPATGSVENDGDYSLNTSRESGLSPGRYQVSLSIREVPQNIQRGDRPPPGKLLIPEKYELSTTSGLEFEVVPGRNSIDIKLSSSGPSADST